MNALKNLNKRHFTDAARLAAAEGRRRKREAALPLDTLKVFVVRQHSEDLNFGWEIRRFGAVVVEKSLDGYLTIEIAREAGRQALVNQAVQA